MRVVDVAALFTSVIWAGALGTVVAVPKRNRAREQRAQGYQAPVEKVLTEQERAAKLFVESVKAHDAVDRAERQRVKDAAERAALHEQLRGNKQAAADMIKRLRASERKGAQVVEAEAAYRVALAELQEFETGVRPHWAPAPPPTDDQDGAADGSDHSSDGATGDGGDEDAAAAE